MQGQDSPEDGLDSLAAAVAAETGLPMGRVKKVLLTAQRHQQAGTPAPTPPVSLDSQPATQADPLRFYPLGANGRIHPPLQQPRAADVDTPA
jgi:hypothetical protein